MKTLFVYLLLSFLPIVGLWWLATNNYNLLFVTSLLLYTFIYRPLIDGYRLIQKGVIKKNELLKYFAPYWGFKYWKEIYSV